MAKAIAATKSLMVFLLLIAYVIDASPMRGNVVSKQVDLDCGPSAALTADDVDTIDRKLSATDDHHVDDVDPDCGPTSAVLANGNKDLEVVDTKSNAAATNGGHTDTTEPDCGPSAGLTVDTIGRELSTNDDHIDVVDPDCGPSSPILANDNKDLEAVDTERNMVANGGDTNTTEPECGPSAALTDATIDRKLSASGDHHVDDVDPDCGPSSAILANENIDSEAANTKSNVVAAIGGHTDTTEPDCGPSASLTVDTIGRELSINDDRVDIVDPDCGPSSALHDDDNKDLEAIETKSNVVVNGARRDTTEPECGPTAALVAGSKSFNSLKATNGDNKKPSIQG